MMSSTLGAPLGGTTVGGQYAFESLTFSLITPPNFGGGGASCLPSIVVVAPGEPGMPVTCCATSGADARRAHARTSAFRWSKIHLSMMNCRRGCIRSRDLLSQHFRTATTTFQDIRIDISRQ